jgi:hypothetical protein
VLVILGTSAPALASKLDWSTGYYQIDAKTKTAKGSISSFSTYQISSRHSLLRQVEVSVGYTLLFSGFFSGDMGFGPDLGLYYFPFTTAARTKMNNGPVYLEQYEPYRPFVVAQFQQRQFQSIQTSYAGFSVGFGTEYWFDPHFALRVWSNVSALKGPMGASAAEKNLLIGFTVEM